MTTKTTPAPVSLSGTSNNYHYGIRVDPANDGCRYSVWVRLRGIADDDPDDFTYEGEGDDLSATLEVCVLLVVRYMERRQEGVDDLFTNGFP